ncbi:MAG: hypothetical protein EAZ89_18760 [Bacteroidetes bacterium]|nr:MAG: hypothetical protein EAZ89_18760 [Bacteroidota bacterium]
MAIKYFIFGLIPLLAALFVSSCAPAGKTWEGSYKGDVKGESLTLMIEKENEASLSGTLNDGYQIFLFKAEAQGTAFTGTLSNAEQSIVLPVKGSLKGTALDLEMEIQGEKISAVLEKNMGDVAQKNEATSEDTDKEASGKEERETRSSGKERDPRLVGTWEYQENRSDPFGGSTFNQRMVFFADGGFGDGGSDASVSGGGGSGLSTDNTVTRIPNVSWHSEGKNIYFTGTDENGRTQTEKLGRYHIENGAMLITSDNGKKVLFYKK